MHLLRRAFRLNWGWRHAGDKAYQGRRQPSPPCLLAAPPRALLTLCFAAPLPCEQELAAIDISNSAVYFKPLGSAAQGAAMASATTGGGGGCSGCASGEDGGGLAAVAAGPGGVAVAPPEALTQLRTPASPDALASYAYDLLVGADGAASTASEQGGASAAPR